MSNRAKFETVIGLEVHVELNTKTKIFCSCKNEFGAEPNTYICPNCLGLPGSLPVFNGEVLHHAIKAGLALGCSIAQKSKFDRKNYYYPDLPKAYQISQFDMPIAVNGRIDIVFRDGQKKRIGITRLHMEEDAGKLIHLTATGQIADAQQSLVDYNRGGVPLAEIVSEPDMRTPEEAYLYLTTIKSIMKYINVSDCNMEEGSLRCDANVSIRPWGQEKFGTKVEIKNMNSFKNVQKALEYEVDRQTRMTESGEAIVQETRLWDTAKGKTFSMRSKEGSHDYRYFPEPDLPPLEISNSYIETIAKELPELPLAKAERFVAEYGIPAYDAGVLTADLATARWYEKAAKLSGEPKQCSNWIMGDMMAKMNEAGIEEISDTKITPENLSGMIKLIKDGTISGKIAKQVFEEMFANGGDAAKIVKDKGLVQITDAGAIEKAVEAVIAANAKAVDEIKGGKVNGIGFLVGQVMKQTGGKANPQMVNELLRKKISG
ncbi:MAG: Asp-tRNA(Asn)/Glu-tRNA(Gln) amidotransferase subunit GatB [Spirochaetia bacterium]|nr:Asp-tRNA(Asn)/Glu-tRNA(Gln) amidotransferase subunit GatB [Spirochaetia bacterium]